MQFQPLPVRVWCGTLIPVPYIARKGMVEPSPTCPGVRPVHMEIFLCLGCTLCPPCMLNCPVTLPSSAQDKLHWRLSRNKITNNRQRKGEVRKKFSIEKQRKRETDKQMRETIADQRMKGSQRGSEGNGPRQSCSGGTTR